MAQSKKSFPTFHKVSKALRDLNSSVDPAETHGLLTALFCAQAQMYIDAWVSSLVNEKVDRRALKIRKASDVLKQLFENTMESLKDDEYSFKLLLPADSESFLVRIEAFSQWCQGFVVGLNLAGVELKNQKNADIQEAIDDLVNFSCLRYDEEEEGDEEAEQAYAELVEYARVAVMLIYSDKENLIPNRIENTGNETLH